MFILNELNAAVGVVWFTRLVVGLLRELPEPHDSVQLCAHSPLPLAPGQVHLWWGLLHMSRLALVNWE